MRMIVFKNSWECFQCGTVNPNTLIECKCGNTKKYSENGREHVGMMCKPDAMSCRKMSKDEFRAKKDKYLTTKGRLERIIPKFMMLGCSIEALEVHDESTTYWGFSYEGYHFTVRRECVK